MRTKFGSNKKSNVIQMNESMVANRELMALASTMVSRAKLASALGKSYDGDRNIYTALGYKTSPTFDDYYARYSRQDIAKRIVNAPADSSWRKKPEVSESEDGETAFEKAWTELLDDTLVYHYLTRVDRITGIGEYGVLLMGFDDGLELYEPIEKAKQLLYIRPYSQINATVKNWDTDTGSERYGKPLLYSLKPANAERTTVQPLEVHYSRVLHIAENCEEDDIYGTPRLKSVLNRLQDLELVSGGSAEMFWRGAFPGLGFQADADAEWDPQVLTDLRTEIEEYMHGMKRYLRLKGIDIEQLTPQVADPSKHISVLIDLISGATGIPKRILIGSERGELASSQDENNWNARVAERREDFAEPIILRPFINKLIEVGVLPEPKDGYTIFWPPITSPDEKTDADVLKIKTEAITKYSATPGADLLIPPDFYLTKFLGLSEEEVQQIEQMITTLIASEQKKIEEERAQMEIERAKRQKELDVEGDEDDE